MGSETNWARYVRTLRRRLRLRQSEVADHLGVSQTYVSRLESGHAEPTDEIATELRRLAENPRTRSVFDDFRSTVRHSPVACMLLEPVEDGLRIDIASAPMKSCCLGEAEFLEQAPKCDGLTQAAQQVVSAGAGPGEWVGADWMWQTGRVDQPYWRAVFTAMKDEAGNWFLSCSLSQVTAEEARTHIEAHGPDPVMHAYGAETA